MKIKLIYKLFGAFLITTSMIVIAMIIIMRYYASSSFRTYVDSVELERYKAVVSELESYYQKHQSLRDFSYQSFLWRDTLFKVLAPGRFEMGMPRLKEPDFFEPPVMHHRRRGGPGMGFGRRLSLFDKDKQLIVGSSSSPDKYIFKPITYNGETVGWLGLRKIERFSDPLHISFIERLSRSLYIVGAGILILAAIVSYILSRHLLAPINQLTKGTKALAARQFDTQIHVTSRDELGQLAEDFNVMAKTLEKYESMRKQWFSDVSHELGTPLSILRGEIEAMQDGVRDMTPENLLSLHTEVIRISKIVHDLKELALSETGKLSFNKDSLNPLHILNDEIKRFIPRLEKKGIDVITQLTMEEQLFIAGDEIRLSQLFSNLLENTLRYTDSPGTLKIWETQTKKEISLNLEDSAPGISEEDLLYIFDRFYRVEQSRSRETGGSGLGLAICKQIVEAHGGSITASDSSSGGLHIEIILPKM